MDKHYSDEELLSDLDGELSKQKRRRITQHLEFCWLCRTRQAELERQIQRLSASLLNLPLDPGWQSKARANIASFQSQFEQEFAPKSSRRILSTRTWGVVALAASLILVSALSLRHRKAAPILTAKAVLTATQLAAGKIDREPVHQVFEVKEVQVSPAGPSLKSRLEIWSDARSHRFASKWTVDNGHLKHAIWSTGGRSFVFASDQLHSFQPAHDINSADSLAGAAPDLHSLEAHFMSWLEERPWKPLVFLADVSLWEGDGATLRVDRLSAHEVRLTVEREHAGVRLELVAVLSAENSLPVLQKLRLRSAGRTVEFQLSSETTDTRPVFSPAVFSPDRDLVMASVSRNKYDASLPPKRTTEPRATFPVAIDVDAEMRRLHAQSILHLAGACKGVPVTISQEPGGVQILSSTSSGDSHSYFTQDAGLNEIMSALAEIRAGRQNRPETAPSGDAAELFADGHALQILAASFDQSTLKSLPLAGLTLLRRMVEDHANSLRQTLTKLNGGSLLSSDTSGQAPVIPRAGNWREAAFELGTLTSSLDAAHSADLSLLRPQFYALAHLANDIDRYLEQEMGTDQRAARLREGQSRSK